MTGKPMTGATTPLLELRGITKRFPGVLALDQVSLALHAGEVHMLMGENGAGKSTLMKVLCGAYTADAGQILANGAKGEPCTVRGRVLGLDGKPVADAVIEVWQADADGNYDVQYAGLDHPQARGVLRSGPDGRFHFRTIVAEAYPIPTDGPVGDMLRATARHPWRPAHLHFMIKAEGYERLVTHVFRSGDAYLDSDAVFGVRQSLVADWVKQPDGSYSLDFDFVLKRAS